MVNTAVTVGGVDLRAPLMPASGTFSADLSQVLDLGRLAALVLKTVTYEPRTGNPLPRVAESPSGMLNSIGIPNQGVAHLVEATLPQYTGWGAPVIPSVSAGTSAQFAEMVSELTIDGVAAIELNISCPNLEAEGEAFAMSVAGTEMAVSAARAATSLPLWVKLTPNTSDLVAISVAAENAGADALVIANSFLALAIDVETRQPRLGGVTGGLTGPAIRPLVVRMVHQVAGRVSTPIVGCGGIESGADVVEYLLAGATAVQVGTASFRDPAALPRIESELVDYCERHRVFDVAELVGAMDAGDCAVDHQLGGS